MQLIGFGQIHTAVEQGFQLLLKCDHFQQGMALFKIHQQIKVTAWLVQPTSYRTENPQVVSSMAFRHRQHLLASGLQTL